MIWIQQTKYCPEQWYIYLTQDKAYKDPLRPVAYFRLRHGRLAVHPCKYNEIDWSTTLYEKFYKDERGCLFDDTPNERKEFDQIRRIVNRRIRFYLIKQWFKKLWN